MSVKITEECIACGACADVCPNEAIFQGDEYYQVDPTLCSECVGFHDKEQCMEVCPVDAPITDPENEENEEELFARAKQNNPEHIFETPLKSHFRS